MSSNPEKRTSSSQWVTLREAADHFRVSETTIRLQRPPFDSLRHRKVGRRTLIPRADIEKLDSQILDQQAA
jgi:hypothetical protein